MCPSPALCLDLLDGALGRLGLGILRDSFACARHGSIGIGQLLKDARRLPAVALGRQLRRMFQSRSHVDLTRGFAAFLSREETMFQQSLRLIEFSRLFENLNR